jgi:hypothetical protein
MASATELVSVHSRETIESMSFSLLFARRQETFSFSYSDWRSAGASTKASGVQQPVLIYLLQYTPLSGQVCLGVISLTISFPTVNTNSNAINRAASIKYSGTPRFLTFILVILSGTLISARTRRSHMIFRNKVLLNLAHEIWGYSELFANPWSLRNTLKSRKITSAYLSKSYNLRR